MKPTWLPALALPLLLSLPAPAIQAKPETGPISPATRCAVFWSAMSRIAPQGSEAHAQMTAQKDAWLAVAEKEVGATQANRILNNNGPAEGAKVREMAGNPDALQQYAAAYSDCESAKAAATPTAATQTPTVSDRDKETSQRAFKCAGMAQFYQDIDNFIAADLYGTPSDYRPIIDHLRPDMPDAEKEAKILSGLVEFAGLQDSDNKARQAATMAGRNYDPVEDGQVTAFSKDCARMVNGFNSVRKR